MPRTAAAPSLSLPPVRPQSQGSSYVTRPENLLRQRWSENQLVLFDSRITQHYAVDHYDGLPRRLHRVTIAGDVPVGIEGKESYSIEGDAAHYTSVAAQRPFGAVRTHSAPSPFG